MNNDSERALKIHSEKFPLACFNTAKNTPRDEITIEAPDSHLLGCALTSLETSANSKFSNCSFSSVTSASKSLFM